METKSLPLPAYHNNLALFASQLRAYLLLSQDEAAAYFYLDRSRISRYENDSARDIPKIGYLAGLAQLIAAQADDVPETQQALLREINEAIRHHYPQRRLQNWAALSLVADQYRAKQRAKMEAQNGRTWQTRLEKRLDLPPATELIGVDAELRRLNEVIFSTEAPWVVCVEGMGGLGKTALANALVRQPTLTGRFQELAWVSAKQQTFWPGLGLVERPGLTLDAAAITDALLQQLDKQTPLSLPPPQKRAALAELLNQAPHLIIIDNLETVEDYQALLPLLGQLANPSKFLLTSRYSLQTHADVFTLPLTELDQAHTIQFIRSEAQVRGLTAIATAPQSDLDSIYQVAGGNPLALKLIVGQIAVLSLSQLLDNLKQAKGQDIQALYNFLYWSARHLLDATAQQLFLAMPLAQAGTMAQLLAVTQLDSHQTGQALQQLATLSLVQIKGDDLNQRRYTLHRLTETFLLKEAWQWQRSI